MLWTSVAEATGSLSLKPDLIRQTITGSDEAEVISMRRQSMFHPCISIGNEA